MQFYKAVIAGVIVMVLFALITVNILAIMPLGGPLVGSIVAGYIAGKDFLNGAKAGIVAGLAGGVLVALDMFSHIAFIRMSVPQISGIEGVLFLVLALIYFPILGFIGGAAGGILKAGPRIPAGA